MIKLERSLVIEVTVITCAYHLRDAVIPWATGIPWNFEADAMKSVRVTGLITVFKKVEIFPLHRRFTIPACLPESGLKQYSCPRWILCRDFFGITNTTLPTKGICHIHW